MIVNRFFPARIPAWIVVLLLIGVGSVWVLRERPSAVVVGSKKFTESVVLGEIATQLIRNAGVDANHRRELGGTRILFNALQHGDVDVYAEYTGTLVHEILKEQMPESLADVEAELQHRGILMTRPLGFNNTYAVGMRPETADRLGIRTISDLRDHPQLRLGWNNEFLDRGDGWPSLRLHYRLPHEQVRGLDHDLAYRALEAGEIDAMDVYTTDAEISYYGLRVLEDDLEFFPAYEALFLYRADLPEVLASALHRAEHTLEEGTISRLNGRVKLDGETEAAVAADFVGQRFGIVAEVSDAGFAARLRSRTAEHLFLVGLAMLGGVVVAIPLGVLAAKLPRTGQVILGAVGMIQTIPALALLVFMIPLLGIYEPPAIAALFLYSLLPMVRNTVTGLRGIPLPLEESAEALGLSPLARLTKVDLPLASPAILAGIKTSTVITIGFATLGALIGAGGYGQPIFTGIRLDDFGLILEGAVPAALLALVVQGLFQLAESFLVPRGLRLRRTA
jgi:osmoprotectant transport system permease protein